MSRLLKYIFAVLIIAALFFFVDLRELLAVFRDIDAILLIALIALSFVMVFVSAVKWRMFLSFFGLQVSLWKVNAFYYIGYFVNLAVPSHIGGDAMRSWLAAGKGMRRYSAAATILERFTGLLAMVLLGVVAGFLSSTIPRPYVWLMFALGVTVLALTVFIFKAPSFSEKWQTRFPVLKICLEVRAAFVAAMRSPRLIAEAMLLSFVFHCLTVVNVALAAYTLGWGDFSFVELFVLLPFVLLIGALPITPMGLGVQEGAFFFILQLLGATPEMALAIPILLRAKSYVLTVPGAVLFFMLKPEVNASAEMGGEKL